MAPSSVDQPVSHTVLLLAAPRLGRLRWFLILWTRGHYRQARGCTSLFFFTGSFSGFSEGADPYRRAGGRRGFCGLALGLCTSPAMRLGRVSFGSSDPSFLEKSYPHLKATTWPSPPPCWPAARRPKTNGSGSPENVSIPRNAGCVFLCCTEAFSSTVGGVSEPPPCPSC